MDVEISSMLETNSAWGWTRTSFENQLTEKHREEVFAIAYKLKKIIGIINLVQDGHETGSNKMIETNKIRVGPQLKLSLHGSERTVDFYRAAVTLTWIWLYHTGDGREPTFTEWFTIYRLTVQNLKALTSAKRKLFQGSKQTPHLDIEIV